MYPDSWSFLEVQANIHPGQNTGDLICALELRNAIYALCRPEGPEKLVRNHNTRELRSATSHVRERLFLPLTHVNRQIRQEFLSIYMQDFHHTLRVADIPAYTRAFPRLPNNVTGTVLVDIRGLDYLPGHGVDVTSLFRLRAKHPQVDIKAMSLLDTIRSPGGLGPAFGSGRLNLLKHTGRLELIDNLFAKADTPQQAKWLRYVDGAIKQIWINPSATYVEHYKCSVRIMVKSPCKEWWMSCEMSSEPEKEVRKWVAKSGCTAKYIPGCVEICAAS